MKTKFAFVIGAQGSTTCTRPSFTNQQNVNIVTPHSSLHSSPCQELSSHRERFHNDKQLEGKGEYLSEGLINTLSKLVILLTDLTEHDLIFLRNGHHDVVISAPVYCSKLFVLGSYSCCNGGMSLHCRVRVVQRSNLRCASFLPAAIRHFNMKYLCWYFIVVLLDIL